ncbi:hypothetical protein [Cellulomonas hominis]|uniref:hypothetical protein n=1 Tax=Cellulomonas hominis TaxID=156981 RepID=UPI0014441755|nr:hypothetical protein [Cellulomonas hominis]NKY08933.1 hypothetical protein [Cellulomonas hominis]
MATRKLRAVGPDEPVPAKKPQTVSEAAETGDRRALLVALRDRIAKTVTDPDCPPRDLASLSRRLVELGKEISAIDLAEEQEAERGGPVADGTFDKTAI